MIRNYLLASLRNMARNKGYSAINIAGLAVGIGVSFLIFLWVVDELSYDRFHEKSDGIYRSLWEARVGDHEWHIPLVPVPLAETLGREFPEVEHAVRFVHTQRTVRHGDEFIQEADFVFTEPSFFDVFTVRFMAGNPQTALRDPQSVILTDETAGRYFPGLNAVGQTIELSDGTLLNVTGVVEQWPQQSHFHFNFLGSIEAVPFVEQRRDDWGSATVHTYFSLREGENIKDLDRKVTAYLDADVMAGSLFAQPGNFTRFPSQPLTDVHLGADLQYTPERGGNIVYVYLFSVIAVFVLLLACINFVNLSTARAAGRLKEVGVRKVLGSQRGQLIGQFMVESLLYVTGAVAAAVLLVETVLPYFNQIADKSLSVDYFGSSLVPLAILAVILLVSPLAGAYPAVFLSAFRPAVAVKGQGSARGRGTWLRSGLVVSQFCVSIALIVGTLVVRAQLSYMQEKNLGFDREHVVVIHGGGALGGQHETFIERLEASPYVRRASAAQSLPGYEFDSTLFQPEQPANYELSSLNYAIVDHRYVEVLGMNIREGRNFSAQFPTDSSAFLINQAAADALGWENPIGRRLSTGGGNISGPVIGVIEDFHYESLHAEIKPIVFPYIRWTPSVIVVRLQGVDLQASLAGMRETWSAFVSNSPFEYTFLDQDFQRLYDSERQVAQIFSIFSALAIVIACLGVFGLAAYTAEQRTKEIGVRKVLGASMASVVALLSKDFARLVLISAIIAVPVGYVGMNRWLQDFAYRIEIGWWIFAAAGGIALIIALLTVSSQALKAAVKNPVEALRYE